MEQIDNRTFKAETGKSCESFDFRLNCHVCGKSFSPLHAVLVPTDKCEYYLGTYSRLYRYALLDEPWDIVCEHLRKIQGLVWLYDPKDDMQGKKLAEGELEKANDEGKKLIKEYLSGNN